MTDFQSKRSTNLPQTKFWCQKQNADRNKNFEKNAMSEAKTMEFGWKAMNLLRSLICWPNSKQKVALICLKWNSGAKNKTTTETKILKKMPCRMPKRWNLAEKWWTSYGVLSVDPFPIENCTNLSETEFWISYYLILRNSWLNNLVYINMLYYISYVLNKLT